MLTHPSVPDFSNSWAHVVFLCQSSARASRPVASRPVAVRAPTVVVVFEHRQSRRWTSVDACHNWLTLTRKTDRARPRSPHVLNRALATTAVSVTLGPRVEISQIPSCAVRHHNARPGSVSGVQSSTDHGGYEIRRCGVTSSRALEVPEDAQGLMSSVPQIRFPCTGLMVSSHPEFCGTLAND
jgi:hypothetical protein